MFPPSNTIACTDEEIENFGAAFALAIKESDSLCLINDPETTPYASKYKARSILLEVEQKLEAYSVILRVDSSTSTRDKKLEILNDLFSKIACIRVRIGTISYECDEPHNAEKELELACNYYFPLLVDKIEAPDERRSGEIDNISEKEEKFDSSSWYPPELNLSHKNEFINAMKCLNMLGILWAGRGQVKKSFLYLLAAKNLYHSVSIAIQSMTEAQNELESLFTHTLFYLAQAYGHISEIKMSSRYCHETLKRQLKANFATLKMALEWTKNAIGISDFYLTMQFYRRCCLSLFAAEKFLHEHIVFKREEYMKIAENRQLLLDAVEMEADIHRRRAHLDAIILKKAFDRELYKHNALERGETIAFIDLGEFDDADIEEDKHEDFEEYDRAAAAHTTSIGGTANKEAPPLDIAVLEKELSLSSIDIELKSRSSSVPLHESLFPDLQLKPVTGYSVREIITFEHARAYFLRATQHIEAAKKYFVLDGFVSDHANLLQEQSKLYHYLAGFESDIKRKLAMETKRIELLQPLLLQLSQSAYEGLHKQISFELGDTYMSLLEIKLDKFRTRSPSGEVNINALKKAEVIKCNHYCKGALAMFAHFSSLYANTTAPDGNKTKSKPLLTSNLDSIPFPALISAPCLTPDTSLISEDEVRPFLNSHFFSCRILSKVMVQLPTVSSSTGAEPETGAYFLTASLRRYQWLHAFALDVCLKKGLDIEEVFGEELAICENMKELLPAKIDRMHWHGESGLSI